LTDESSPQATKRAVVSHRHELRTWRMTFLFIIFITGFFDRL